MRNIIAGTAGHIDHGKTALVRALTGIDTDRLPEEKRRGISIELGFAHLELPGGLRIGFVDVPGHERFVKTMLAGSTGFDLVLLVVAADESIKPQTREHFEICRLLGIPRGLVALTKADLVEPEILELVRLEIEEFLAGSFLAGAPIVAVSAVTGRGLDELKAALARVASEAPVKDASRHFRLPVDRVFSMRGFGTVVTGTLVSGRVRLEDEVEVQPGGRRFRVRGIQVYNQPVAEAVAGQRTALNLAGAEIGELARGVTLVAPGLFSPARVFDAEFELLASARPLKDRAPVHLHAGTAEVIAEARLLDPATALAPRERGLVRFRLREPVLVLPGDRFIVRMFSPVVTIGGGAVIEIDPPEHIKRAGAAERLRRLTACGPAGRLAHWVEEAPYGLSESELIGRTGMTSAEIAAAARSGPVVWIEGPPNRLIGRATFDRLRERLEEAVARFHRQNPLAPGMPREALRAEVAPSADPTLLEALLAASPGLAAEGDIVRQVEHRVVLKDEEQEALERIEKAFAQAGLAAPAAGEVLAASGVEAARARRLLEILLRQGRLVRVGAELIVHSGALEALKQLLAGRRGERFTVSQFKDWTGVSRKYAVPLLEYLDRARLTRREGDWRVVL
jgi:selenocysteine-specific elongation factor